MHTVEQKKLKLKEITYRISVSNSREMKLLALLDIPLNCLEGKLYLAAVMSFMVAIRDTSLNGVIPLSLNNIM